MRNLREIAFYALCNMEKERIEDYFARITALSEQDLRLSKEVAYGTAKRIFTLDYWAKKLSTTGKLQLSAKEKMLLRMALYQFAFLDRVPLYAIVDETVNLAKKHFGKRSSGFFNALLRKLPSFSLDLPKGTKAEDLSLTYSYPAHFITLLLAEHGIEKTKEILEVQNHFYPLSARLRKSSSENRKVLLEGPLPVAQLDEKEDVKKIGESPDYYIQNPTPAFLIAELSKNISPPKSLLDFCASPGGKLFSCHDLFPTAELYANDVSEKKCALLQSNLNKYGIQAEVSCTRGEEFISDKLFDLIILDVPCSNSGVLHKRPEARWRLLPENIQELKKLQMTLVKSAFPFLAPGGQIWYLTCSILNEENEGMMQEITKELPLSIHGEMIKKLPDSNGFDGGFACALKKLL